MQDTPSTPRTRDDDGPTASRGRVHEAAPGPTVEVVPASSPGSDDEAPRPARVLDMQVTAGQVTVLFATGHRDVPLTLELTDRGAHALAHLAALHGHAHGCGSNLGADVQVGLLLRTLRAAGCPRPLLIVRTEPSPGFWLQASGGTGLGHLDLDVLDALVLLMSQRVDIAIAASGRDHWERTFDRLLDEGPRR